MAIPTASWNETNPASNALRSEGDDRIRELKSQLREILEVDHIIESAGQDTDWGRHDTLSLKVQGSSPAQEAGAIMIYSKDVSAKAEMFVRKTDGTEMQLTSAGHFIGGLTSEIRMWSGLLANIPTGWALCDGNAGRPNLIGKFIRGVNTAATNPGTTGGSDTMTTVINHTHDVTFLGGAAHTHTGTTATADDMTTAGIPVNAGSNIRTSNLTGGGAGHSHTFTTNTDGAHSHSTTSAEPVGAVDTIENRPAYYELAFIIRT